MTASPCINPQRQDITFRPFTDTTESFTVVAHYKPLHNSKGTRVLDGFVHKKANKQKEVYHIALLPARGQVPLADAWITQGVQDAWDRYQQDRRYTTFWDEETGLEVTFSPYRR